MIIIRRILYTEDEDFLLLLFYFIYLFFSIRSSPPSCGRFYSIKKKSYFKVSTVMRSIKDMISVYSKIYKPLLTPLQEWECNSRSAARWRFWTPAAVPSPQWIAEYLEVDTVWISLCVRIWAWIPGHAPAVVSIRSGRRCWWWWPWACWTWCRWWGDPREEHQARGSHMTCWPAWG